MRRAGRIVPLDAIRLPGEHNLSNVCAAVAVGLLYGIEPDAIAGAIADFRGVEHRLELVATIDGIRYVNDSQGTQPDAVIAALRSFPQPLVLIAGGRSKGLAIERAGATSWRSARQRPSSSARRRTSSRRPSAALASSRIERAASMDEAVRAAAEIAREQRARVAVGAEPPPATVLLSPAAASFDMFTDYEARGAAFKAAVARLGAGRDRRGRVDERGAAIPLGQRAPSASRSRDPADAREEATDARPAPRVAHPGPSRDPQGLPWRGHPEVEPHRRVRARAAACARDRLERWAQPGRYRRLAPTPARSGRPTARPLGTASPVASSRGRSASAMSPTTCCCSPRSRSRRSASS